MGLVTCLLDDSQATFHLDVGLGSNGVERGVGHERWLDWFGEFTGRPLADVDLSLLDGTVRGVRGRCGVFAKIFFILDSSQNKYFTVLIQLPSQVILSLDVN